MSGHPRGVTFKLETATALFSHGANGAGQAEVRAQPFEAAARYWFRALAGGSLPLPCADRPGRMQPGCPCLRCEEGRVFGSADHGRGVAFVLGQASPRHGEQALLPHHEPKGKGMDGPLLKDAVLARQELVAHVIPGLPTTSTTAVQAVAASLLVALLLGGIGQRSRRGAGDFVIKEASGGHGLDLAALAPVESPELYAAALHQTLASARASALLAVRRPAAGRAVAAPFPMLIAPHARIVVAPLAFARESEARAEVMMWLRPYKNASFGLPYMRAAPGDTPQPRGRHASPLWIHLGPGRTTLTVMKSATVQGTMNRLDDLLDSVVQRRGGVNVVI